jgi:DNA polymerase
MARWFPQQTISRVHGQVKVADGRLIVPMYHPAAALHQSSLREVLIEDFRGLRSAIERARRMRLEMASPAAAPARENAGPPIEPDGLVHAGELSLPGLGGGPGPVAAPGARSPAGPQQIPLFE